MKKIGISIMVLFGFIGCENDEYLYNDVSRLWIGSEKSNARVDSLVHSFQMLGASQQEDTLFIPVNVMGNRAGIDRPFAVEVVTEESNVPSNACTIGTTIIPANSFQGIVPIVIRRAVSGLDLTREQARVTLQLVANEYFELGIPGTSTYKVIWCDFLIEPATWSLIRGVIGTFSQARYRFIMDVTGETEFSAYEKGYTKTRSLLQKLRKALNDYNADPANAGRPEGWPYLNDDGNPLTF
jgi:hypothetical protein